MQYAFTEVSSTIMALTKIISNMRRLPCECRLRKVNIYVYVLFDFLDEGNFGTGKSDA